MAHIYRKRQNTKLLIIQKAAKHFIEEGYSATTISRIANELDLSLGNITFYFPTKEHMLAYLADELFDFQTLLMEHAAEEGQSSLLAYCLELTSMTAASEESEVARDFFASTYASGLILPLIRENDLVKTKSVFGEFRPEWTEVEWRATENIVSGIEYATIMTYDADVPLELQIRKALDSIMSLYGVPADLRQKKIDKVLSMDYRALGRKILAEFREYIDKVNEEKIRTTVWRRRTREEMDNYLP